MENLLLFLITLLLGAAMARSVPTARTVYGAVGLPVTLTCSSSGENLSNQGIAWQWNGDVLNLGDSVKAEGANLTFSRTSLANTGTYSCHAHTSGKELEELDRILLKVGYLPEKPNITCHSFNYPESFHCVWKPGTDTLLPTNISAFYRNPMSETFLPCELVGDGSCIGSDLVMYSSMAHLVTVRVTNPLGSAEGRTRFVLENIIQPDPPGNVSARASGSEAVTVSWMLPESWLDPFLYPLQHRLRFRLVDSGDAWKTAVFPGESVEEQEVRGLRPHRLYEVQVSIKDLLDQGHWSDWSESAFVRVAGSRRRGLGECHRKLYAAVGSRVRIPCKGTAASRPKWTFNGAPLRPIPSTWRQGRKNGYIYLLNVTLGSSGVYSCQGRSNSYSGRPHKRCTNLQVGYPPTKPIITCRSFDYPDSFQCDWRSGGDTTLNTSYSASYRNPLDESPLPCEPVADNACQGREVTLFSEQPHELMVTATNVFGSVETHHSFLLEDIVQPDPPMNVQARWRDVRSVLVSWEQPTSWNPHPAYPLTYRLHFRTPGAQHWNKVRVRGESTTSFVLELPVRSGGPQALEVCVSAREALGAGAWSTCSPPSQLIPYAH